MFVPGQNQLLANLSLLLFLRIFRSFVFMILKRTFEECVSLFSYQRSFFCIAVCLKQLCYYIMLFPACQEVFQLFLKLFLFLSCSNFYILSHPTGCCQELFSFLFHNFFCQTQLVYIITSLFRCQELFSFLFHPTQKEGFEPSHGANRLYP